jgi:hypothetical protein
MTGMGREIGLPWTWETGRSPGVYRPPGLLSCLRGLWLRPTRWLLVTDGVVVLVPVLKRRASVEFRHGHLLPSCWAFPV